MTEKPIAEQHLPNQERGSVTIEFVMVLPLLVVAMLFLIGLGYTLMTKQNSIVAARAAVFYRASLEEPPRPATLNAQIKDAVSPGREEWTLTYNETNMEHPGTGNADVFAGAISRIYDGFNSEIHYRARGTATLGFLPGIMELGQAESSYYLPHRTWTCAQVGGSYGSVALHSLGVPDPISRWLDTSCCETYEGNQ